MKRVILILLLLLPIMVHAQVELGHHPPTDAELNAWPNEMAFHPDGDIIVEQDIYARNLILGGYIFNSTGQIEANAVEAAQWQVTPNATTESYTFPTQTKRIKWALLFIDDRLYEYNSGATIRSATNPGFDAVQGATLGTHGGITVTSSLPWSISSDDAVTANLIYQLEDSGIPESGSMFIPSMLVRASKETVTNPEPAMFWGGTTMTIMRY